MHNGQDSSWSSASTSTSRHGGLRVDEQEFQRQYENIQGLLDCQESNNIVHKVKNEDIVMFIGNTKSGKSTLVNYAIGNDLEAVKKKVLPFTMSIVKVNDHAPGPVIGLESVSESTLPTIWSATQSGIREKVVDAPGFEDNRGEVQDIANAFYIKEIIRNANSIKFVLITDINDIMSDNISSFTSFIDKIDNMFPETEVLHGGIAIVFSKGDGKCSPHDICNFLYDKIIDQDKMIVSGKGLIKYFADNEECVSFFKMPTLEGSILKAGLGLGILGVIENVINGIPKAELANVKPGVSDRSRVFLLQLHAKFCNMVDYLRMLEKAKDGFARKTLSIYELEKIEEISAMDEILLGFEKSVNDLVLPHGSDLNLSDLHQNIVYLGYLCDVSFPKDDNNMLMKLQFIEFIDETLGMNNAEIYREKYNGTVEMIKNEINVARLLAATRLNKMTIEQAEAQKMELKRKHVAEMEKYNYRIRKCELENQNKAAEQLKNMGVFDHLAEAGKKILTDLRGWFSW